MKVTTELANYLKFLVYNRNTSRRSMKRKSETTRVQSNYIREMEAHTDKSLRVLAAYINKNPETELFLLILTYMAKVYPQPGSAIGIIIDLFAHHTTLQTHQILTRFKECCSDQKVSEALFSSLEQKKRFFDFITQRQVWGCRNFRPEAVEFLADEIEINADQRNMEPKF